MSRAFFIVEKFIRDVYGFPFLKEPMDSRINATGIRELKNAYDTIMNILQSKRKPLSEEFIRNVYPLLEIAIHWNELRKLNRIGDKFLTQCQKRVRNMQNFYGTIFELDMASRGLLSDWDVNFIEDTTKQGRRQIDFVFTAKDRIIGVDCLSKRVSGLYTPENLTIGKINNDILDHADKFRPEYLANLGIQLNEKVLAIDITRKDYQHPELIADLKDTQMPSELDMVVYTWREDFVDGESHSLIVKYQTIGNHDYQYFATTYQAHFHGSVFMMGRYRGDIKVTSPSGLIRSPEY